MFFSNVWPSAIEWLSRNATVLVRIAVAITLVLLLEISTVMGWLPEPPGNDALWLVVTIFVTAITLYVSKKVLYKYRMEKDLDSPATSLNEVGEPDDSLPIENPEEVPRTHWRYAVKSPAILLAFGLCVVLLNSLWGVGEPRDNVVLFVITAVYSIAWAVWRYIKPNRHTTRFARTIERDDDGDECLVLSRWEYRRTGRRFRRKKQWELKKYRFKLDDNPFVDEELARRISFEPLLEEKKIFCVTRLSWWMKGWSQIGLIATGIISLVISGLLASVLPTEITVLKIIILSIVIGGAYLKVWMEWAYRYLIITNERVVTLYDPPFNLKGDLIPTLLGNIVHTEAPDQSVIGNWLGYGVLTIDTPANTDDKLHDVKFVPRHTQISNLLDNLRISLYGSPLTQEEQDEKTERETRFFELGTAWFEKNLPEGEKPKVAIDSSVETTRIIEEER